MKKSIVALFVFCVLLLIFTSCVSVIKVSSDEEGEENLSFKERCEIDMKAATEKPDDVVENSEDNKNEYTKSDNDRLREELDKKAKEIDGSIYEDVSFNYVIDDYGKLLPYVGEFSEIHATRLSYERDFRKYGLCTENGDIVIDAKNHVISDFRCFDTSDGFSYYAIGVGKVKDFSIDGFHPQKTYIIPKDGSWCVELEEGWWGFCDGVGGICASLDAEKVFNGMNWGYNSKTLLFDYKGNLIKEFGQNTIAYSRCKYCFALSSFENDPDDSETYYYNKNGNRVNHDNHNDFNEYGVRIVCHEKEYFLENENGDLLNDIPYEEIKYFSDDKNTRGVFVARLKKGKDLYQFFFYDKKGNLQTSNREIFSKHHLKCYFPENGDVFCYFTDKDDADVFFNINIGEVIHEDRTVGNRYTDSNDNIIVCDGGSYEDAYGELYDYSGRKLARFDDFYWFRDVAENGKFVIYTSLADYDRWQSPYSFEDDNRKTYIYDVENGEYLYSIHGNSGAGFVGNDERFVLMYVHDSDEGGNTFNHCLYDTKNKKLVVENAEDIKYYQVDKKDYFAVSYLNSSILYDSEMNEIIKTRY